MPTPPTRTPLRMSADRRYLVDADGRPFFFLADTNWTIVWKGEAEQWSTFLDLRQKQGFSLLQVNLLPWRWEMTDVEGNRPFHDGNPDRPNEAYFARFDRFFEMAAERGLVSCLMLIWGGPRPQLPAVHFSTKQAVRFATWAVRRFGKYPMIWSLSGDAPYEEELEKWEAVGDAVEKADTFAHPTTNHLPPHSNWRALHHTSTWHDFHMIQTGHTRRSIDDIAALPTSYYAKEPTKAFVNGEPWYEAHPSRDVRAIYGPVFTAEEQRYAFWVSMLSGATMGHTYGSQGVWNWKRAGDDETEMAGPQIGPTWNEAMHHPGARQIALGVDFLRTVDWWRLRPCPERVVLTLASTRPDRRAFCAHIPGELYIAYRPANSTGQIVLKGLEGDSWSASWLDPRTGEISPIGSIQFDPARMWTAPPVPSADDWVIVARTGE